jgi:cytoskeletal protein CcmA (bactofilin family)
MHVNGVSILGEDASLSGRITVQDLTILGTFEGDLTVRGRLQLGPKAKVNAKVQAQVVEVEGSFQGEIRAGSLTFAPTANARGLFLADRLGIREGALVEGSFNLATESDARPAPKVEPPKAEIVTEMVSTAEAPKIETPNSAATPPAA